MVGSVEEEEAALEALLKERGIRGMRMCTRGGEIGAEDLAAVSSIIRGLPTDP